ncbi:hypothetical protein ACOMHN_002752 [Nucella lapillus]
MAARLPALLWIVFFYSLNIPKMVDFRGFQHSDVPKEGRGETGPEVRGIDASLLLPAPFPKVPRGASGGCRPYMFRG